MPESLKAQVLVKAQFEDPEIQMKNQEITKTKTVQELSQINSLAEFPIPKTIETLLEKKITLEKSHGDDADYKPRAKSKIPEFQKCAFSRTFAKHLARLVCKTQEFWLRQT